ncbi:hypothetical protein KsCSTR_33670 [Candidatus Kuenenia stuttgartiensis]|uniref:Uncharacterized protein n=1 Tax=Kuenenia stuttgartiensis TaxID=174633 RepID=A0A6G7GT49_KUEST|nr:hypothetical protein KsCSTR_33670 [Candidatus Kuenenia stuttgartiensis]
MRPEQRWKYFEHKIVSIPYRCNETAPKTYGGMGSFLFQFLIGAMRLFTLTKKKISVFCFNSL